jgi:hypothetical protein
MSHQRHSRPGAGSAQPALLRASAPGKKLQKQEVSGEVRDRRQRRSEDFGGLIGKPRTLPALERHVA